MGRHLGVQDGVCAKGSMCVCKGIMWVKECVCNEEHVCVSRACVQRRARVFKGTVHIKRCVCNEEHMCVQGGTRSVCLKENMSCMRAECCAFKWGV